jgi:acetylornithine deacetylase
MLPPGASRFLINGEPTENKLALATKGLLRCEVAARGKLAHSAYPELGESAIEKLLDVLQEIRKIRLPEDPLLGRSAMNIGVISGGRAPNVIPDAATAEIAVRLVGDAAPIREAMIRAVGDRAEVREVLCIPPIRFDRLDGFETCVVAYTTNLICWVRGISMWRTRVRSAYLRKSSWRRAAFIRRWSKSFWQSDE